MLGNMAPKDEGFKSLRRGDQALKGAAGFKTISPASPV